MHSFVVAGWASGSNCVFLGPKRCMSLKCCMMCVVHFTINATCVSRIAQHGVQCQNAVQCALLCCATNVTAASG